VFTWVDMFAVIRSLYFSKSLSISMYLLSFTLIVLYIRFYFKAFLFVLSSLDACMCWILEEQVLYFSLSFPLLPLQLMSNFSPGARVVERESSFLITPKYHSLTALYFLYSHERERLSRLTLTTGHQDYKCTAINK